jgi:choline kinase
MSTGFEAVVLAAGRGSRLGAQSAVTPKALLPIGPRSATDPTETSFLRRQLELLREHRVERVVVVVGFLRERVVDELRRWAPWAQVVTNPTPNIGTSGSLHSFQCAARSRHGVLDGTRRTLLLDADIVYHRALLRSVCRAAETSTTVVCDAFEDTGEEVLVFGTERRPRHIGKALDVVDPVLGEAVGAVVLAPADHAAARGAMDELVERDRATEHEALTQRLMDLGRMRAMVLPGAQIPFMECDTPHEYRRLRTDVYPRILQMEVEEGRRRELGAPTADAEIRR